MLAVVGGHERGYLDPSTTRSYGDGSRPKKTRKQDSEEGETEDRLTHRRKYGGEYRRAWVRVQPYPAQQRKTQENKKKPSNLV
jgi:hypothetical protein